MLSAKISDGTEEAVYSSVNETYARHVEAWHKTFGMDSFVDEEHEKLIEYGKFLISLRKKIKENARVVRALRILIPLIRFFNPVDRSSI